MDKEYPYATESLIPATPIPAGAEAFSERVQGLLDGRPKDDATVKQALEGHDAILEVIAAGLYNLASMLVGEGEESIQLVETAIATAEISACESAVEARRSSRLALCRAAIAVLDRRDPGILAAPEGLEHVSTCIEDDDLDAAGVSREELATMMAGPDRDRVRTWLASLPIALRVIFVLRAVAGFTSSDTAELLAVHGGAKAVGWNADGVRELFRQALCSLASQLIHATTAR